MLRRVAKVLVFFLIAGILLLIGAGLYARSVLRGSLPLVEGSASVAGLSADVRVERDALGVPTITAASREDAARALGFVHAQDRLFQMDLQRRQPAGELSALVGARAFALDEDARVHRFRDVARRALDLADPSYRRLLDAYTEGVNAGIAALSSPPFEYLMLQAAPEPWRAEDTLLTILAMFNTLQGRQAAFERTIGAVRDTMPEPMFRFLTAAGSEWETPVTGSAIVRPPVPGPEVFDLRNVRATEARKHGNNPSSDPEGESLRASALPWLVRDPEIAVSLGSNNWAVAGTHTASGTALVANDMHLAIGVPAIWYRASMVFPDTAAASSPQRLTGLTLPGLPAMVVGSNGHVAWGFTNTGGDWSDLVRLDPDPGDPSKYLTPDGPRAFDSHAETITAKDGAVRNLAVRWTIWGPVVWKDARGREYAQRWVAHDAEVLSSDISRPERARSVDELLAAMAGLGMPHQNVTMGDASGRIAWTIGGAIPRRIGHDGLTPESWADGTNRWDGYLTPAEFPHILDPESGRIWTANAPVVDAAMLAAIGEGGYADGIRARLIRDRLLAIDKATPEDMLSVQLDDRALFLERWRQLLLDTIGPNATAAQRQYREVIDTRWTGRASPDSSGYRLVREFRSAFVRRVMTGLTAPAHDVDPAFDYARSQRGEGPVWQLLQERPVHLLDPAFKSWDDLILATVDDVAARLTMEGRTLAERTWGEFNRGLIVHPLAASIPYFGTYLNMPSDPLPGDVYTPRASTPLTGPSERMAVSPGRESEGIMHIPTGQSAHPLSPHLGDQYGAWLAGEPTPFLPGLAVHTLTLRPRP